MRQSEIGRRIGRSKQRVSQYVREGMPCDTLEAAMGWLRQNYPRAAAQCEGVTASDHLVEEGGGGAPSEADLKRGDIKGSLARAIEAEMAAYSHLQRVSKLSNDVRRARAIDSFSKATRARLQIEELVQQIETQRPEIITTLAEVDKAINAVMKPMRAMLDSMPAALAHRLNPTEPDHARVVLREELDRIYTQVSGEEVEASERSDDERAQ